MITKISTSNSKIHRIRVIVAGDPAVGKSAIVENICTDGNNFLKSYMPTSFIAFRQKMFSSPSADESVEVLFLDSSGMEVYESINKKTWPQDSLFCLVYDVTKKETFDKIPKWLQMVQPYARKNSPGFLLANKVDLSNRRFVSESYGMDFAQKNGLQYHECSAKENVGLHDLLLAMAREEWQK